MNIAYAIEGDLQFQNAVTLLTQLFKEKKVTLFAGAGISRPSGLPVSATIVEKIVTTMCKSVKEIGIATEEEQAIINTVLKKCPLERLLDAIVSIKGERGLSLLSVLNSGSANFNHWATAQLAKNGFLNSIVTLNFDVLFEKSLSDEGITFNWDLPLASVHQSNSSLPTNITITKPHGSLQFHGLEYKNYYLAATLGYGGDRTQKENIEALSSVALTSPVLFIMGYSNHDWDISPILKSIDWSYVFWIEYYNPGNSYSKLEQKPCHEICNWLSKGEDKKRWIIYGDSRAVLSELINKLGIISIQEQDLHRLPIKEQFEEMKPDISILSSSPEATAFIAISLLDGIQNELYARLLPKLQNVKKFSSDLYLHSRWEKSMAWFYHAHRQDLRLAIKLLKRSIRGDIFYENEELVRLSEYRSIFYEYISTLKRPFSNPFWSLDLIKAIYYRQKLIRKANDTKSRLKTNPWVIKSANAYLALADYYVIDLYHNLGYYLLPFKNNLIGTVTKYTFKRIASRYDTILLKNDSLDWEYYFVRKIEAHLLAHNQIEHEFVQQKLQQIYDMFVRTEQVGHQSYAASILAIVRSKYDEFTKASSLLNDLSMGSTPSGVIRMFLLQRYFWPQTISFYDVMRKIFKFS